MRFNELDSADANLLMSATLSTSDTKLDQTRLPLIYQSAEQLTLRPSSESSVPHTAVNVAS